MRLYDNCFLLFIPYCIHRRQKQSGSDSPPAGVHEFQLLLCKENVAEKSAASSQGDDVKTGFIDLLEENATWQH